MGKNKSNVYCESCKKFHSAGKHDLNKEQVADLTGKVSDPIMVDRIMRRATRHMYFDRNFLGDAKEFKESDVVKEVDENGSGRDSKENT